MLALDTATENCSAALWLGGEVRLRSHVSPREHSARLLGMVDALLAEAGLGLRDLDALAFGRGPGGFTGVRIAASVAQGLALGAGLGLVAVSDLQALAWRAWAQHRWPRVLAVLDARMGELYVASCEFEASGRLVAAGAECLLAPEALTLPVGRWCGAGPGWAAHPEALAAVAAGLDGCDAGLFPDAGAVATLAAARLAGGEVPIDAAEVAPVYLRNRVATPRGGG
ncbi:MAG: tRNA (adenosine(37)-N6)-threonylcarbamoyltransferase complex dimerization subunit type 1 TsaB [Gammaproteobacteria bacterium]|nr:MAG: tRNA (adenosine(37)-N6)-threonylcarbamoyltransferase complex dimerization subunit type 1 TsaB [Gammaproteobacteria bacterium]